MNVCHICGQKAAARVNARHYVCKQHADATVVESLKNGNPVIIALKGVPRIIVVPELIAIGAAKQNLN